MSVRRSLLVLTLITLLLPVVVYSLQAQTAEKAQETESANIQLHTVAKGDVSVEVNAIGSVEASEHVQLSMRNPGRIQDVFVQEGDYVLAGDVLVRQATDTQQINYEQAQLNLQLAQLQLEDLQKPVDENDIRVAEANVQSAWASYNSIAGAVSAEDLSSAQLRIDQAQAAYDEAVRQRSTAQSGQSDEAYSLLDAQVGQASFNLEIARQQYQSLQTGNQGQLGAAYARALQAQRQLEQVQAGPSSYQIELVQIGVDQAQTQLDSAALALNQADLVAPYDGIVGTINVEVGSLVSPGLPVLTMTDVSSLHVVAEVDEVDIRRIAEQMPARVQLDALPGLRLPAQIDSIAVLGTDDGGIVSYDVQVSLDDVDPRIRDGMTAEADVIVEQRKNVLVVPNQFIRLDREQNRAYVNLVDAEGQLKEIEITLGLQGQDSSEVVSGLNAGDVIAIDLSADRFSFFGG